MSVQKEWIGWVAAQKGPPKCNTAWRKVTEGASYSQVLRETVRLAPPGCWSQVLWYTTRPKHATGDRPQVRGARGIVRLDSWDYHREEVLKLAAGRWLTLKEIWEGLNMGPYPRKPSDNYRAFLKRLASEGLLQQRRRPSGSPAGRLVCEYTLAE